MKARANKLDPFAGRLREWEAAGRSLAEMQAELKADGCSCSLSSLSDYLARLRQESMEGAMFATIASGGKMNRELDAAYAENPAPEIEQLIRISKTLIMSLQVQGVANPKLLALANTMQQTVLNYLSGRTKAELDARKLGLDERKLELLEKKAQQADAAMGLLENKELSESDRAERMRAVFGVA